MNFHGWQVTHPSWQLTGNHSVSGGGWTHVVLSEPLNGDFQEGILIGRMELQARSEASSVWGINAER
jgi:hypothetical protein